jgi:integrase
VRASELLGATVADADPGQQLITVVRKGSRALQPVPASADAFVWLRLYQAQMAGLVPSGRDQPLWWTLRRPFRPLSYHAAYRMFTRANAVLGANWSLHDLRHTAAYRMEVSGVASAASFGSWRERRGAGLRGQRGAGGAGASAGRHAA